jgi:hypothetical protein
MGNYAYGMRPNWQWVAWHVWTVEPAQAVHVRRGDVATARSKH